MNFSDAKWVIGGLLCFLLVPGAFLAPALVDYFDTQEHVITSCTVLDALVHFHKNGCERCYDEDDCEDYDCFSIEYNVKFKYKDRNMTEYIEEDDEFEDSQDAYDRITHDHPIGSTDSCVVNPKKKGGYQVKWGNKVNNVAWIVLFVFFGLCSCLWLMAAAFVAYMECGESCKGLV